MDFVDDNYSGSSDDNRQSFPLTQEYSCNRKNQIVKEENSLNIYQNHANTNSHSLSMSSSGKGKCKQDDDNKNGDEVLSVNEEINKDKSEKMCEKNLPRTKENEHMEESSECNSDEESESGGLIHDRPTDIIARREYNILRNESRLRSLGLLDSSGQKLKQEQLESDETELSIEKNGMLMEITDEDWTSESFFTKYPFRTTQIRLLTSIVDATVAQSKQGTEVYVPPPIFIFGPSATGKTSITKNLVESYNSYENVGTSYINCATLSPRSIEALVECAFRQIKSTFKNKKHPKKKVVPSKSHKLTNSIGTYSVLTKNKEVEKLLEQGMEKLDQISSGGPNPKHEPKKEDADNEPDEISSEGPNLKYEPEKRKTRKSNLLGYSEKTVTKKLGKDEKEMVSLSLSSRAVPLAFGQSLAPFIGIGKNGCAFLILDHAERLMSLTPGGINSKREINYLTQLLLLPKALELNLTIIIISRKVLLMHHRIDNTVSVKKSSGTLIDSVHPISIHFNAYLGNSSFAKILKTPENLAKIVGNGYKESNFQDLLINAFLGSLIQGMEGMTRDIRDMICAGRYFWPFYIEPLSSTNVDDTMAKLKGCQNIERAILAHLDQLMMKLSQRAENCLLFFGCDDQYQERRLRAIPYLPKFLLLASFICQHNKAAQDSKLFKATNNGKRRKKHHKRNEFEAVAFAEGKEEELRGIRPRAFPLERMLSVFRNIVTLHQGKLTQIQKNYVIARSFRSNLGHSIFLESISQLRASGFLREIPKKGGIMLDASMYCCEIEIDDAIALADSVQFSLEKYLLSS